MNARRDWTPAEDEALKADVAAGVSLQRLVIRFNKTKNTITSRVKFFGLEIKPIQRLPLNQRYKY